MIVFLFLENRNFKDEPLRPRRRSRRSRRRRTIKIDFFDDESDDEDDESATILSNNITISFLQQGDDFYNEATIVSNKGCFSNTATILYNKTLFTMTNNIVRP